MTTIETSTPLRVCAAGDLADDEVAVVEVPGRGRVAVFHTEGEYFGIADQCSHQKAFLSDGFVENCAVECPLHSSAFSLRTGMPDAPPARIGLPVYDAWSDGDAVFVSPTPRPTLDAPTAATS